MEDGRVWVSLGPGQGGRPPVGGVLSAEAAKAFAWGLLADLDPHEAHARGAPVSAFGPVAPPERTGSGLRGVFKAPGPMVRAVLALCPVASVFKVADLVDREAGLTSVRVSRAMHTLKLQELACVVSGGGGHGRCAAIVWQLTPAGVALRERVLADHAEGAAA
jgi:hypothetical protein